MYQQKIKHLIVNFTSIGLTPTNILAAGYLRLSIFDEINCKKNPKLNSKSNILKWNF